MPPKKAAPKGKAKAAGKAAPKGKAKAVANAVAGIRLLCLLICPQVYEDRQ